MRGLFSPVPTQTMSLLDGATATSPIDTVASLSNWCSKVTPLLLVFSSPPEAVATHQVDVGFMQVGGEYPGLDLIPVPNLAAACMVPEQHPLARKKAVKLADLEGHSLISLGRNSPLRARTDMALAAAKVTCRRPIETSLGMSACALAAGGLGVAIVDPFTAASWDGPGVVRRKLQPAIPFEFSIVLPAHQPRPAVVSEFIALMMEIFREKVAGK